MKLLHCALLLVIALTGCAAPSVDRAKLLADWTRGQGGELFDARLERVSAIGGALAASAGVSLHFHVLQSQSVVAYSWPGGDVYLSAGLVDAATDQEIAAAIAHEIGHLAKGETSGSAAALRGSESLEIEAAADAAAIRVLAAAQQNPKALVSLLSKVSAASPSRQTREDIQARIKRIQARLPE